MDLKIESNLKLIHVTKWMILTMVLIIPIQIIIFLVIPMPSTSVGWMKMFQQHPFLGLLHMDFLYIINNTFLIFFYYVLYITLRKERNSWLNFALITGIVGAVLYYTSNRSVEMLYLANRFQATDDMALRTIYLGLAESYLDIWKGTAFNTYYVLSAISLLTFSFIMLKDTFYTKKTAVFGLVSGCLMIIPSSFGLVGMIFALISLIPWIGFSVLVAIRLFTFNNKLI